MTVRLLDADHRHRFTNLQGLTADVGTVGGRGVLHSGGFTNNFFETEYDNTGFGDTENDNDDFFDVAGSSDWSMWFKARIVGGTADVYLWGGDSVTSAPCLKYLTATNTLVFEVNGTGGRRAEWVLSQDPTDFELFTGGVSFNRATNTLIASNLKSHSGEDITPTIDTTSSALPGADGIRYGANIQGASAAAWRDAFYIIGEAVSQTDLDETNDAFLATAEYQLQNSDPVYSDQSPTMGIQGNFSETFSGSIIGELPSQKTPLYGNEGKGQLPGFEAIYSDSGAEGPIITINPLAFSRKLGIVNLRYFGTDDSFFGAGSKKFSNINLRQNLNAGDFFSNRRKFNDQPSLLFNELNLPPQLINPIPDQIAFEDSLFDYIIPIDTFDDPEDDTIIYTATLADDSPLPTWLTFNPTIRRFLGTPLNDDVGVIEIKVNATDGFSPGNNDFFFITILNVNDPPTTDNLIPDQNIVENNCFTFQFASDVFSDEDVGDQLTYTATLSNGDPLPSWLVFTGSTRTFEGVPPRDAIGVHEIKVLATDLAGASTSQTFNITVGAGFHEPLFPENISYGSSGGPGFNTAIIEIDSGAEERVSRWTDAKRRYNVAYGIRSHEDLSALVEFYLTMQGAAGEFRFKDWLDYSSTEKHITIPGVCEPGHEDQFLGTGDGVNKQFQLIKSYEHGTTARARNITKPISGTLRVGINGVDQKSGWSINTSTGILTFTVAPPVDAIVTAGFEFHVFCRFGREADALLSQSVESFGTGSTTDIPVVELRDDCRINNEFFFGGALDLDITADTEINLAMGRLIRIKSDPFANLEVILPPVTDLEPGGPYFYLVNRGVNFLRIVSEQDIGAGLEIANLQEDETLILLLAQNGTNKEWIAL